MNSAAIPSIFDTQSLSGLKSGLRQDDPQALKAAARQFEAVFLQMVLKSMRAATPQEGMLDSEQTRFYQELLDSQLSQVMSAKGGTGLAAMIEKQLARQSTPAIEEGTEGGLPLSSPTPALPLAPPGRPRPLAPAAEAQFAVPAAVATVAPPSTFQSAQGSDGTVETFSSALWPHAEAASRQTGISPQFFIAQAALETGWGKYEPRLSDGRQSYNLFGIKANSTWSGPVAEASTTEYVDGKPVRRVERFRAYGSHAEAFADYARLLNSQPRYARILGAQDPASFARGLQDAGYASDPAYAEKLTRVIGSFSPTRAFKG